MTSLYVDRRCVTLKADGEALVFYENGERIGTVPLAPLSRVFIRGDVTLSSSLLGKLGERGIGVVVLSGRKALPTMLLGRPHNDAARRVAQYRLSLDADFCLRFSRHNFGQSCFTYSWRAPENHGAYLMVFNGQAQRFTFTH